MAKTTFEQFPVNIFHVHTKENVEYSNTTTQTQSTRFLSLKWWIYCGYYLLALPFRPANKGNGRFTLNTNIFQTICRFGLLALSWTHLLLNVIKTVTKFKQATKLTAKNYFNLAFGLLQLVGSLNFHWILWKKRQDIEDMMVDFRSTSGDLKKSNKQTRWKMVGYVYLFLVHFIKILLSCSQLVFKYDIPSGSFNATILQGRSDFAIFLDKSNMTNITTFGATDISLGVTSLVTELAYVSNEYFIATLFSGIIPVTFWLAAKEFQAFISTLSSDDETKRVAGMQKCILQEYDRLKGLTDSINSIWGGIYFAWMMEKALSLMLVNEAVSSRNISSIVYFITEAVFPTVSLVLIAEGCRITSYFREWMSTPNIKKSYFTDAEEWERLSREIDVDPVGIGATGLYKINYGFLGQLIAVVITLFTISFD